MIHRATALVALLLLPAQGIAASTASLRVVSRSVLPASVPLAYDVRWKDDHTLLLAAGRSGVMAVDVRKPAVASTIIRGGGMPRATDGPVPSFFFSSLLAKSPEHLIAGSWFRAFAWLPAGNQRLVDAPFANILDLDVRGDRLILLGVRGDATGRWGSVGATLWSAKLTRDRAYLEALPGPDVEPMRDCQILGAGAVRFQPNGSFFVAPGVEPGVRLHDAQGRLIRTWPTEGLGYLDRCSLTAEQSAALSELAPRRSWQNRREMLDELVVLPEGPMLIVRQPVPHGTKWRGILLPFDGKPVPVAIPVTSSSPYSHVKADVRGNDVAFVMWEALNENERPVNEPRIVIAKVIR
jgi:hypothetical protein